MTQHAEGDTPLLAVPTVSPPMSTITTPSNAHHHNHNLHQKQKQHPKHQLSMSRCSITNGPGNSEHYPLNPIRRAPLRASGNNSDQKLVSAAQGNSQENELRANTKELPNSIVTLFPSTDLQRVTRRHTAAKPVDTNSSSNEDDGVHSDRGSSDGVAPSSSEKGRPDEGKTLLNGSVRGVEPVANSCRSRRLSAGVNCKKGEADVRVHVTGVPIPGHREEFSHMLRNRSSCRPKPYKINQRGSSSSNKSA